MKFNISTIKMKKLLTNIFKTNIKTTNRIYSTLNIEAKNNKLIVTAHNNVEFIQIEEKHVEIYNEGNVKVDSKLLFDLIKNIDDISLEFQLFDESLLNINTLNSVYKINVLNLAFPQIEIDKNSSDLEMKSQDLVNLIKHTLYAVDNSGINPIISGINLKFEENIIKSFSTDSFRLANSFSNISNNFLADIIIYKKSAKDLISLIEENDIFNVKIKVNKDSIVFLLDDIYLSLNLISGKYPRTADVDKFINDNQISINIDKNKLENIIKRLMIFSNDESKSIILSIEENKILFQNENNIFGNGVESLMTSQKIQRPFNILVPGIYLAEAIKHCSQQIILKIESESNPIIIEDDEYKTSHLIIPLNM